MPEIVPTRRLAVLKESLKKKEALFEQKISSHFEDVRSANGQPLNDKRNGRSTMSRWDRQNDGLRSLQESIAKTRNAIEREQDKIANVSLVEVPDFLLAMMETGEIRQWRRHPNTFFVAGVDKGRIVWDGENQVLRHRYAGCVPKDQYPRFCEVFNKANAALRKMRGEVAVKAANEAEMKGETP